MADASDLNGLNGGTTPGGVRDTGPLQSKKFLVILLASLGWKILIGGGLLLLKDQIEADSVWMWWWMMTATVTAGFVEVGGLLGIAFVDKYVRVAKIMADGAQNLAGIPKAEVKPKNPKPAPGPAPTPEPPPPEELG